MENEEYYIGTDLKFKIDITASGFSQADDDYKIKVVCNGKSMIINKEDVVEGDDGYYILIPSDQFQPGLVKIIVTATVDDDDFVEGRREVEVKDLCYIKKT